MKPLLDTSSLAYQRRLVRALNSEAMTGHGFYANTGDNYNQRCNRARLHRDTVTGLYRIEVKSMANGWEIARPGFCTAYGEEIVASRRAQ